MGFSENSENPKNFGEKLRAILDLQKEVSV